MLDLISAHRYLYFLIKNQGSIAEFEQWLYSNDELEQILGEQEYYEFISRNYKNKYAFLETEKQVYRIIQLGRFEQERLELLLNELLTLEDASRQLEIMHVLYEEYCSGYSFLRYIALTYITTSDEYKEMLIEDKQKSNSFITGVRREASRLLGFFGRNEIIIEEEHDFIDHRTEKDRIEMHSIDKMLNQK
ncbi:hypothetical protein [Paenibacillus sp. FSL M7-1046]|uniref:hypothetical protein n=1 Tax=Paenibacillus sp. FSL M7-1046 TaxID=2975315 RepID=UPI0030FB2B8F